VTSAVPAALRAAALDAPDVRRPLDHVQGDASLAIDHIDFPRLAGRTSKNMWVPRMASTSSCRKPGATVDRLMHHARVCKTSG
jgi:hypothetical protein